MTRPGPPGLIMHGHVLYLLLYQVVCLFWGKFVQNECKNTRPEFWTRQSYAPQGLDVNWRSLGDSNWSSMSLLVASRSTVHAYLMHSSDVLTRDIPYTVATSLWLVTLMPGHEYSIEVFPMSNGKTSMCTVFCTFASQAATSCHPVAIGCAISTHRLRFFRWVMEKPLYHGWRHRRICYQWGSYLGPLDRKSDWLTIWPAGLCLDHLCLLYTHISFMHAARAWPLPVNGVDL